MSESSTADKNVENGNGLQEIKPDSRISPNGNGLVRLVENNLRANLSKISQNQEPTDLQGSNNQVNNDAPENPDSLKHVVQESLIQRIRNLFK